MVVQRDDSIDSVCGLLILTMILYHCLQWADFEDSLAMKLVSYLGFFMPWFFFKGGMYFRKDADVLIEIKKGFHRLIVPFIKWSVAGLFLYYIQIYIEGDVMWSHYILTPIKSLILSGAVSGNPPLWFLLSLFFIRIISCYILKIRRLHLLFGLVILCLLIAYILNNVNCRFIPLYLANTLTGLFFFIIGHFFKIIQYSKYSLYIGILIYCLFCIYGLSIVDMRKNIITSGSYLLWPICAISGIVLINNLFRIFERIVHLSLLSRIGENSLLFFVMHWLIITTLYIINGLFSMDSETLFIVSCMANVAMIVLVLSFKKNMERNIIQ